MPVSDLGRLYRRWMLELWNGDLSVAFEIEVGPVVEGDLVAARWVGRDRYRGGMPGATAPDGLQLMAQLGALGPGP